jgi:hypothetical protein
MGNIAVAAIGIASVIQYTAITHSTYAQRGSFIVGCVGAMNNNGVNTMGVSVTTIHFQ